METKIILALIEKWETKHRSILDQYSMGNANNEVMQMYRSNMKDILGFIFDLYDLHLKIITQEQKDLTSQMSGIDKAIKELKRSDADGSIALKYLETIKNEQGK